MEAGGASSSSGWQGGEGGLKRRVGLAAISFCISQILKHIFLALENRISLFLYTVFHTEEKWKVDCQLQWMAGGGGRIKA